MRRRELLHEGMMITTLPMLEEGSVVEKESIAELDQIWDMTSANAARSCGEPLDQ